MFPKRKKSYKTIRKLVQARYANSLKKKLKQQDKQARIQQRELAHFYKYDRNNKDIKKRPAAVISKDEVVILGVDSPYMYTTGGALWSSLEKVWLGFKIGKRLGEDGGDLAEFQRQKEYAVKIQDIQKLMRLDVDDFSVLKEDVINDR